MGIREKLEKHPVAVKVAVGLMIAICAVVIYSELNGPRQRDPSLARKAFYSDDDGKTWFLDDISKNSPFDHQGKKAYQAVVFRCPNGHLFVAFLGKYSDEQKSQDAVDLSHAPPGTPSRLLGRPMHDLKKPGESKWETYTGASETGYPEVKCPDGNGVASLVRPTDPDAGGS